MPQCTWEDDLRGGHSDRATLCSSRGRNARARCQQACSVPALKSSVSRDRCLFMARTAAGHRAGESEEDACHIRSRVLEPHLFITEPPHPSTFTPASSSSFPPLRCLVLKSQSCPGVKYWWQAEHTRSKVHGVTCELMQLATRTTHAFCNQTDPRWPAPGTMRPGEFFERIYSAGELAQVWLRRVQRGETHFRCRRTGPAHSRRDQS